MSENKEQFDINKMNDLIEKIKEETKIEAYKIIRDKNKKADIFSSKFGGVPYWDLSKEYPVNSLGKKMPLLTQINFEKENLNDMRLPTCGILQFFISSDDVNGLDFDKGDSQKDFRIIYHEKIDNTVTEDKILALDIPTNTNLDIEADEYFPFNKEYAISFEKFEDYITPSSYDFENIVKKILKENWNEEVVEQSLWKYFSDKEYNCLYDALNSCGHKSLGYPFFTQWDPRENNKAYAEYYDTLLLQIDTDEEIMWGDSGVANFFINSNSLKQGDFSKILYNWDCF